MAWIEQATLRSSPLISVVLATRNRAAPPAPGDRLGARLRPTSGSSCWSSTTRASDETAALLAADARRRVRGLGGAARAAPTPPATPALDAARGELIAYLDDDNAMHPGWLKSVVWAFEQRPEADVVYGALRDRRPRAHCAAGRAARCRCIWFYPYDRAALAEANLGDTSAIAHRAGLAEARFDEDLSTMGDWDLLARLTTERDPLVLPAIACFYSTDAPRRLSASGTLTDAETIRRRARVARGLVAPATPIRNPGPLLARVLSEGPLELGEWALSPSALELVLSRISGPGAGGGRVRLRREHDRDRRAGCGRPAAGGCRRSSITRDGRPRSATGSPANGLDRMGRGDRRAAPAPRARPRRLPVVRGRGARAARATRSTCSSSTARPPTGPGSSAPVTPRCRRSRRSSLPGATVVLDDLDRAGERWVVDHWEAETGSRFERLDEEGVAIRVFSAPQGGNSIE